ncbi:uncharacterized protein LOC126374619 [Pectinophora gossypiella]|uniref:uncharacterized protein LOC126374619 n=1 Tax=Pectinophora gossypiella TaxID=13191 RepID=UPI00214E0623|nr:uncharacterized protein LOC126374619 [Pectinophora gossypiella]
MAWSTQRKHGEKNKNIENHKKFKPGEKKKGGKKEENKEDKTNKKPEKIGSKAGNKEEKKDSLANVPLKTDSKLSKGRVSFLFVNKLFSDTNLSKHIEVVKDLDATEAKKKYDLSSVKGKILEKMINDYKHTVSLTGLIDEPNRSTSLITKTTGLNPEEVKKKLALSKNEGKIFDQFLDEQNLKTKKGEIDKEKVQKLLKKHKKRNGSMDLSDVDLEDVKKMLSNRSFKDEQIDDLMEDWARPGKRKKDVQIDDLMEDWARPGKRK